MLILSLLSSTSSVPFSQWTGAGSMDWHPSHVLMAILTANSPYEVNGTPHTQVSTASVHGHDLVCVQLIYVNSADQWLGSILHLHSGEPHGRSAMFLFDGTNTTSTVSSYSSISFFRVFSCLLISISVAALVRTRVLPVRVSDTQWCTHTESVFTCIGELN